MSIYRPPKYSNLDMFFNEVTHSLSKTSLTCENFITRGDFINFIIIDAITTRKEVDKIDDFCNIFHLTNLIKTEACSTKV